MTTTVCIGMILGGLLFCTLGYAAIRIYCGFAGLLLGFVLGGLLGSVLLLGTGLTWTLAVTGGIGLAVVCAWLYKAGTALAGP